MQIKRLSAIGLNLALGLTLAACATTAPPADHIVTRDVPVPYYQPCPAQKDIPAVPKAVHGEHPAMPANVAPAPKDGDAEAMRRWLTGEIDASHARERILAGKVLEDRTYIERADAIMQACAKSGPVAPQSPAPAH